MNIMNYNRILNKTAWVALAVLALSSCKSDVWKEHYSTNSDIPTMTLAQTIESMPQYSKFVKALKTTYTFNERNMTNVTYWDMLNESTFMTVWLPTNESVADSLWEKYTKPIREKSAADHKKVGTEFLGNHIARFSHTVGSATRGRVMMLSGKGYESTSMTIAGTGYKAGGKNIRCSNGIIHELDGKVEYLPNIYEYLTSNPEFAAFGNWFKKYTKYEIDPEKSVERGIVDGQMEYADSVMKMTSVLLDEYGYINEEDSNFIMLLPKPSVLASQYERIKDYYTYEECRDDRDSLQEMYTYQAMMTDMFFNMNRAFNPSPADSLVSTLFKLEERLSEVIPYHVYKAPYSGIIARASDSVMCSNGKVYLFDEWPFLDSLTFLRPVKVEIEDEILTSEFTYRPRTITVDAFGNPSSGRVMDISRPGNDNWIVSFYAPDNLKGNYRLKMVFRRNTVANRSYSLTPVLRYYSQEPDLSDNKLEEHAILYQAKDGRKVIWSDVCGLGTTTIVDPDTVTSSVFAFPDCNFKTGRNRCKVSIECRVTNKLTHTSNLWMDCIILEPVIE